ncbi:MAG: low specificity L-threonine aldolase [Steroidobacteraceae bacterium]
MGHYFKSDNTAPACPEILAAIAAANEGFATGYGDDPWTQRLERELERLFEAPLRAFPVATGTAANALALASFTPPWGEVLAHREAHVVRDECGAPEFMSGGARLLLLDGADGKVTPTAITEALADNPPSVHTVQPCALSITQATELGTVYTPAQLRAVCAQAHASGLRVHVDGARFANAVASLGCRPHELGPGAGVDVLTFGATKNGALAAEAVVFFDPALARDFELRRKRAGHLFSKMRFVSAQLLAYLDGELWLRNARRANGLAREIGAAAGSLLLHPVEANEVFIGTTPERIAALRAEGFLFYDWGAADSGQARFVVSWNQPREGVEALAAALRRLALG